MEPYRPTGVHGADALRSSKVGTGREQRRSPQRLPRDERRRQYLDAAVELLSERFETATKDSAYALAHVRLTDVATRAGVSKGALYHVWPRQEAYWADLLQALFADMTPLGMLYGSWIDQDAMDEDTGYRVGDLLEAMFDAWVSSPSVLTLMSMAAYRRDRSIYDAVASQLRSLARVYEPMIRSLLAQGGRVLRPDVTPLDFVVSFRSILDGLAFRRSFSRAAFEPVEIDRDRFGIFSLVTEALLRHYSEPAPTTDDDDPDGSATDVEIGSILRLPVPAGISEYLAGVVDSSRTDNPHMRDEAAARYIALGLELLEESIDTHADPVVLDALGNLRISDVAAAAGVSKGSVYRLWSSQEAFRVDVLNHLMTTNNTTSIAGLKAMAVPEDPADLIIAVSDLSFDALKDSVRFYARFGFTFASGHPNIAELLADTEIEVREQYMTMVFDALAAQGRRLRGSTGENLVRLCIEAVLYGTCLVYRHSPDLLDGHRIDPTPDGSPVAPSRFADLVCAMLTHFSEPLPGG